jgi:hypothetical protein
MLTAEEWVHHLPQAMTAAPGHSKVWAGRNERGHQRPRVAGIDLKGGLELHRLSPHRFQHRPADHGDHDHAADLVGDDKGRQGPSGFLHAVFLRFTRRTILRLGNILVAIASAALRSSCSVIDALPVLALLAFVEADAGMQSAWLVELADDLAQVGQVIVHRRQCADAQPAGAVAVV